MPYRFWGLKIFTPLSLRFQDFQRWKLMPANRLSMRKIKEVLRLKWANNLSDRKIAQSCNISRPAVANYVERAE